VSPLSLSIKSLRNRKFTVALTVLSLTLGVTLLLGVERIRREARTSFTNTISGTDLIVGARTGQVSLLLSSVFRIGNATQNISWESYQKIVANPKVAWTIPISLGDTHQGYRVLGTNEDYFTHYRYAKKRNLALVEGAIFDGTYDAVLGAEVARKLGYTLGQEIILAHGAGDVSFVDHADKPFHVVGILAATGTPVDQTVHVSLAGIEAVHEGWDGHSGGGGHEGHNHPAAPSASGGHEEHNHPPPPKKVSAMDRFAELEAMMDEEEGPLPPTQITAFLVGMHGRADAVFLQRSINTYQGEALTAVMPGVALQELWQVVGVVEKTLTVTSIFVVLVSLAGMLSALMTSLNERRREMAILRSVGARPVHIIGLIAGEAVAVTLMAIALGVLALYGLLLLVRPLILAKAGLHFEVSMLSGGEALLLGAVLLVGLLVGLVPAWQCYRNSLADGLTVKV
jgi:putative ABC transport system permease protein